MSEWGLSRFFGPSCMWRGVTGTSKDFVNYRVASFLHDLTHHAVSCSGIFLSEQKDDVVCKNACINPLKPFPAPHAPVFSLDQGAHPHILGFIGHVSSLCCSRSLDYKNTHTLTQRTRAEQNYIKNLIRALWSFKQVGDLVIVVPWSFVECNSLLLYTFPFTPCLVSLYHIHASRTLPITLKCDLLDTASSLF